MRMNGVKQQKHLLGPFQYGFMKAEAAVFVADSQQRCRPVSADAVHPESFSSLWAESSLAFAAARRPPTSKTVPSLPACRLPATAMTNAIFVPADPKVLSLNLLF